MRKCNSINKQKSRDFHKVRKLSRIILPEMHLKCLNVTRYVSDTLQAFLTVNILHLMGMHCPFLIHASHHMSSSLDYCVASVIKLFF